MWTWIMPRIGRPCYAVLGSPMDSSIQGLDGALVVWAWVLLLLRCEVVLGFGVRVSPLF